MIKVVFISTNCSTKKLQSFFLKMKLERVKCLISVLFCLQVVKAAVAQVKAVADGGVTAADLTRAK